VRIKDEFTPHAKQLDFAISQAKFPAFVGGVGSGKTAVGAWKARNLAIINAGCLGVVGAPTYAQLRDGTMREFFRWCPDEIIKRKTESTTAGLMVELINGSKILFRSFDKPANLRSLTIGWGWYDEAGFGPEEGFRVLLARIRDKRAKLRQLLITTSPNGTRNWLFRKKQETDKKDPLWAWFRASSRDNPHNPDDYVDALAGNLSARAAQQEIDGEFIGAEGLVYGGDFNPGPDGHIVDYTYDPLRPVSIALDFGYRKSALLAFQQRREDESWVCFDEEMFEDTGTPGIVSALTQKPYAKRVVSVVHDPAGLNNAQDTGAPSVQILEQEGFACEAPDERRIERGIEAVRFNLAPYRGRPRLFFARKLQQIEEDRGWSRGVLKDIQAYHYPEKGDTTVPEHDDSSHSMDALRYWVLQRLPVGGSGGFGSFRRH